MTGTIGNVLALLDRVHFAYQPLVNLTTGGITAVEVLPRPRDAAASELFRRAARQRRLPEVDLELACSAVGAAAEHETLLPLHVNLLAGTVTEEVDRVERLRERLRETGRRERDVQLELNPPFGRLDVGKLRAGLDRLRKAGFTVALDGVGVADAPLNLLTDLPLETVKLDRDVVSRLHDDGRVALLEAVRHLCEHSGAQLLADGVDTEAQLQAVRSNGVRLVQGELLAPAADSPPTSLSVPGVPPKMTDPRTRPVATAAAGPRVTEFLSPATMLPLSSTADEVRGVLADHPDISGVVLVDDANRPRWTVERNRFLLAVAGPYGHALHATRPAERLADEPRLVTTATTAMEALEIVTRSEQQRMYDDAVVVDEDSRCLGVVRAGDLIRGMAELKVEEAAALNPLTGLPGSDAIAREVDRRINAGEIFAMSWLDIDRFKQINDTAGFSAGDDLIRGLGRSLTDAATALPSVRVGHVGGDDFLLVADLDELVRLSAMVLDPPRSANGTEVTLSLATLVCTVGSVSDYDEVAGLLAPLKRRAKSLAGSSWVLARPGSDRVDVLRGSEPAPTHGIGEDAAAGGERASGITGGNDGASHERAAASS